MTQRTWRETPADSERALLATLQLAIAQDGDPDDTELLLALDEALEK